MTTKERAPSWVHGTLLVDAPPEPVHLPRVRFGERRTIWHEGTLLAESEALNRPARAAREGALVAALVVAVGGLVAGALALAGG